MGISLAVFYGCGVGLGVVSYLARSGFIRFVYSSPFEGSVTVVDALGYPKQMDIFWYLIGISIPLAVGLVYGYVERLRAISTEMGWWIALIIYLAQAPLLAIHAWPGSVAAAAHLAILAVLPAGTRLLKNDKVEGPDSPGRPYRPKSWMPPLLLLIFAAFITHGFITNTSNSIPRFVAGVILWSIYIAVIS